MKALVYHGPGRKEWETVPDPTLTNPTDVIVQRDATTMLDAYETFADATQTKAIKVAITR